MGLPGWVPFAWSMPPDTPKQADAIMLVRVAGQRHACELNGRGVNWYGIRRKKRPDDGRQLDAIDLVLRS